MPNCFKLHDQTFIDLILTNRPTNFRRSQNLQIGLGDCHESPSCKKLDNDKNDNVQRLKAVQTITFSS